MAILPRQPGRSPIARFRRHRLARAHPAARLGHRGRVLSRQSLGHRRRSTPRRHRMVPQDIPRRSPAPRPTHIPRLRRHIHERLRLRQRHICRHTPLWLRIVQHRHNRHAHRRRQHRGRARRQLRPAQLALVFGLRHLPQRVAPHRRRRINTKRRHLHHHRRRHDYNPHRRGKHLRQRPLPTPGHDSHRPRRHRRGHCHIGIHGPQKLLRHRMPKSDSAFT